MYVSRIFSATSYLMNSNHDETKVLNKENSRAISKYVESSLLILSRKMLSSPHHQTFSSAVLVKCSTPKSSRTFLLVQYLDVSQNRNILVQGHSFQSDATNTLIQRSYLCRWHLCNPGTNIFPLKYRDLIFVKK